MLPFFYVQRYTLRYSNFLWKFRGAAERKAFQKTFGSEHEVFETFGSEGVAFESFKKKN